MTESSGRIVGSGGRDSSYKFWSKAQARGQPEGHRMAAEPHRDHGTLLRHFSSKHRKACSWNDETGRKALI